MKKLWPFALNVLLFAGTATVSPYVVLYYQRLGFSGAQIGLLTGLSPLSTLFSAPLWTGLADATRRHRLLMSLAMLLGVVTLSVYPLLHTFRAILLNALLLSLFLSPVTAFADSAAMFMLGDEKELYGRIRLGGTIGYGLASPLAGLLVQNYGLRFAFWGCAALYLLGFFVSQKLVYSQSRAEPPSGGQARTLLTNRRWLLLLIVAFASGVGLIAIDSYFFAYLKELGASESMMGVAAMVGTITEIPVLFFANRLMKRWKPYGLLMLSMIVTGLRMLLLAACRTPALALLIQLLNGLAFPAMWVAGVSYANENAPPGLSTTAQGVFAAMTFGIGAAVGGFVCGPLLESLGGNGLYWVVGSAILVITALVAVIYSRTESQKLRNLPPPL